MTGGVYNKLDRQFMTQNSHIKYQTITRLFWGKFAYKVTVSADPTGKLRGNKLHTACQKFNKKAYQTQLTQHCPIDPTLWRSRNDWWARSFFFTNTTDAQKLIDFAGSMVTEVWQPVCDAQVTTLAADHKIITRENYFWNQFPWCVTFKFESSHSYTPDRQYIEDWVKETFELKHDNVDYFLGDSYRQRKLYILDDDDVVLTRLALGDHIKKIEKVVLTSTFTKEEQTQ